MESTNDRRFAEVANDFEKWRNHTGEVLGCGETETAWRLRGGVVVVVEGWEEVFDPAVLELRAGAPIATIPVLMPGEQREAWFREAHKQLDQDRAAMLRKDGQVA